MSREIRSLFPYAWLGVLILLISGYVFANGGDQRVVDGKYLINLSRSPFTPRQGEKVALLASFVDLAENKLIREELVMRIRIAKLAPEVGKREFLFEQEDIRIKGGVLEFSHTFAEAGLHEIFFDFAFAKNLEKLYEAPDFLMDIQKKAESEAGGDWAEAGSGLIFAGSVTAALLTGLLIGYFGRKRI